MNAGFTIRRATPDDAERLAHIGVATFIESYALIIDGDAIVSHCSRQHARALYADYLADAGTAAFLAELDSTGAPIGYALNCPPDLPVPLEAGDRELKRIYVLSRFHGTGAGAALMAASIAEARARGAARLLLGTYEDNARAIAFYRKHEFAHAGVRKFQVGDLFFDDVILARSL